MNVRELRVTDIGCPEPSCRARSGEMCANVPRVHESRFREFSELVRDGWEWQEVDPTDAGADREGRLR